jgi:hypothetical protein
MNDEQQQTAEDQEQPTDARCPRALVLDMELNEAASAPLFPFGLGPEVLVLPSCYVLPTAGTMPLFRGGAEVMGATGWAMGGNGWVMGG